MAFPKEAKAWGISLLLMLPFFLGALHYSFSAALPGHLPSGFIDLRSMLQMAQSRACFDSWPLFANPASPFYDAPPVYFQPLLLIPGLLWKLTGLPAASWWVFSFLSALVLSRLALALYQEIVGLATPSRRVALLLFFWGGGVVAIAGGLSALLAGKPLTGDALFALEPLNGLWPLNFGRNFLSPHDSCAWALFFAAFLSVLRKRFPQAALFVFLTSLADLFTGTQLLAILITWSLFEHLFMGSREVPPSFIITLLILGPFHALYYAFVPGSSEEYRQILFQNAGFVMHARNYIPAWILTGVLFLVTYRNADCARAEYASPSRRLLLTGLFVSFLLVNNEFALPVPLEPIHFTRGSVWLFLFLLGSPALLALIDRLLALRGRPVKAAALLALMALMCSDNALSLAARPADPVLCLSAHEKEALAWMNGTEAAGRLLLSPRMSFNCHAVLYTPLRAWASYPDATPAYQQHVQDLMGLYLRGQWLPQWTHRPLLVMWDCCDGAPPPWIAALGGVLSFRNDRYLLYSINPPQGAPRHGP